MTNDRSVPLKPEATHVRGYLLVFGALLVLTMVTVTMSSMQLATARTIAFGLTIATAKASLVALFFMHLKREKVTIYFALGLTAVLFAALIGFTLWTEADHARGTRFSSAFEEGVR
jgi:cytochrome c oxidase subunit 4